MKYILSTLLGLLILLTSCENADSQVKIIASGSLKNVMKNGDITPHLDSDSLNISDNLYGLGPAENMEGEILIIAGDIYRSVITNDNQIRVEKTDHIKAPFFVHGFFKTFEKVQIPDSSKLSLRSIESHLNEVAKKRNLEAFCFKINATVISSKIHILNFKYKEDKKVTKKSIHQSSKNLEIINNDIEIIGFYSRKHHGIFTHHDSNIHMHLITKDKAMMGHVDDIRIDPTFQTELLISTE
ncbi:acetolactate decarboxylase [Mangrovivirga sp. M17]|uniref:Alpha-acetolactate decarboxylase n=1 Tax=Mangrovivirga halotolerans TaxID=2993936 RepID=A0ABT3RNP0_9BACT|nr:acetolactate decarboxylase [Mangrovivirga halotolerans]MCX2743091.1 acetolactate decarboxylase [Mangrovivirga halotolerans]